MSRHRNVRSMNYQDEYDGYDDVYGHSVEDGDFCVSPTTAHYLSDRHNEPSLLGAFMTPDKIKEEDEDGSDEEQNDSLQESQDFKRPALSDIDEARLNSCLEEMRNIIGDSTPEHLMVDAVIKCDFDFEKALSYVLSQQEAPKPQRERRQRRDKGAATNNTQSTEKLQFTLKDPPKAKNVVITKTEATPPEQPPARMTFSTARRRSSGFTPEKDEESGGATADVHSEAIETVRRNLELDMGVGRGEHLEPARRSPARSRSPAGSAHATPKRERDGQEGVPRNTPQVKDKKTALREYEKRSEGSKTCINLVVIGHVDAGKSTLMGHTLVQLGFVNKKTIHKYEQESKKMGKASFAFAWVLDETEEERTRGVTMDIAQTRFETGTKLVTLLDAPGHKDFIPNMITGAAQADVAILVVNSTRGEFETGFEAGGQTREHAMLIRSLGVSQLCVAVNKMDTVEWDKQRYDEITKKLGAFLKTAGFRESDVAYIPCSGLSGQNLANAPTEEKLSSWYTGPTLVQQIDQFKPPERPVQKAFRMCISDVFKGMGSGFSVSGTVQAGAAQPGDKVLVMPQGETANVKSVTIDDIPMPYGFAGDNVTLTLTGIDLQHLTVGGILCDPAAPIPVTLRLRARIVIFNIDVPLTAGFPVVFHYGATSEPAHIRKLVSQLHKSTGEVVRKKPRCLTKNSNAVIEIELSRPNCIELYKDYKDLGRFMLRYSGHTIAAGLVTEILKSKGGKAE